MAKGADSKNKVYEKVMELFPGSFLYNRNKELRIPMIEEGEEIQIKMVLTVSKTIVEKETEEGSFPAPLEKENSIGSVDLPWDTKDTRAEVTEEEKQNIQTLMTKLGL